MRRTRRFRKFGTAFWNSRKVKALPNNDVRMVYIHLMTAPETPSIGALHLPPDMIAPRVWLTAEEVTDALGFLSRVGLIVWDEREDLVFLTNHFEFNPICGSKHLASAISQVAELPRESWVSISVLFEIAASVIQNMDSWKDPAQAISALANMMLKVMRVQPEAQIRGALERLPRDDWTRIRNAIPVGLPAPEPVDNDGGIDRGMHGGTDTPSRIPR